MAWRELARRCTTQLLVCLLACLFVCLFVHGHRSRRSVALLRGGTYATQGHRDIKAIVNIIEIPCSPEWGPRRDAPRRGAGILPLPDGNAAPSCMVQHTPLQLVSYSIFHWGFLGSFPSLHGNFQIFEFPIGKKLEMGTPKNWSPWGKLRPNPKEFFSFLVFLSFLKSCQSEKAFLSHPLRQPSGVADPGQGCPTADPQLPGDSSRRS